METCADKLRSVHAQLEYTQQVFHYESIGVPFRTFMYMPEASPITGVEFHEREDDAHILKVKHITIIIIHVLQCIVVIFLFCSKPFPEGNLCT